MVNLETEVGNSSRLKRIASKVAPWVPISGFVYVSLKIARGKMNEVFPKSNWTPAWNGLYHGLVIGSPIYFRVLKDIYENL